MWKIETYPNTGSCACSFCGEAINRYSNMWKYYITTKNTSNFMLLENSIYILYNNCSPRRETNFIVVCSRCLPLFDNLKRYSCSNCGREGAGHSFEWDNARIIWGNVPDSVKAYLKSDMAERRCCCFSCFYEMFRAVFYSSTSIPSCTHCGDSLGFVDIDVYDPTIIRATVLDNALCSRCESLPECSVCSKKYEHADLYTKCPHCAEVVGRDCNIRNYSYKPVPIFHKLPRDRMVPFYGTELEYECGPDSELVSKWLEKQILDKFADHFYMKDDGSISSGFELVTHPMSFNYIRTTSFFPETFDILKEIYPAIEEQTDEGTCGLHVHLSRSALKPLHLFKMAAFAYSNSRNLQIIGRRSLNSYCTDDLCVSLPRQITFRSNDERYRLLNLRPQNTVEFRFFKSTLNISEFMSSIEFVHSLYLFSNEIPIGEVSWLRFMEFVNKNRKEFANLNELFENNNTRFSEFPLRYGKRDYNFARSNRAQPTFDDDDSFDDDDNYEVEEDDDTTYQEVNTTHGVRVLRAAHNDVTFSTIRRHWEGIFGPILNEFFFASLFFDMTSVGLLEEWNVTYPDREHCHCNLCRSRAQSALDRFLDVVEEPDNLTFENWMLFWRAMSAVAGYPYDVQP